MTYEQFIDKKKIESTSCGFDINRQYLNQRAFEWQKDIIRWMLKKGRAEGWEDCGLGKTVQQLEWANQVCKHMHTSVLLFTPLAVAPQTKREGEKFGISTNIAESQSDIKTGINITNYEKMDKFDLPKFGGVVLDESSILKSYNGKTRNALIERCANVPYRSGWSATPAPNDYMEIGNHAEFLGVMSRSEMLATFFVHDGSDTAKWRLKGHAEDKFWEWIASWAVVLQKPSDLGYEDGGFNLPPLNIHEHFVKSGDMEDIDGQVLLLPKIRQTLSERRDTRKNSLQQRVRKAAEIAHATDEQVLVWCDYNAESELLTKSIRGAVEVKGSDSDKHKMDAMAGFTNGSVRVLVSKPSIAGWGMNWQNCSKQIFVGVSDSYEQWYQAIRRCYRFGQTKPVDVHMILSDSEGAVRENLNRKHEEAQRMTRELIKHTQGILSAEIRGTTKNSEIYFATEKIIVPSWLGGKAS